MQPKTNFNAAHEAVLDPDWKLLATLGGISTPVFELLQSGILLHVMCNSKQQINAACEDVVNDANGPFNVVAT